MEMYESGASRADAIHYLKDTYLVSDEKASLCAIVAENEAKVLKDVDYDHTFSLYGDSFLSFNLCLLFFFIVSVICLGKAGG